MVGKAEHVSLKAGDEENRADGLEGHEQEMWGKCPMQVVTEAKPWSFTVWFSSCFQVCHCQLGPCVSCASLHRSQSS